MVIIAGEIDLSVGSTIALSGVIVAWITGKLANTGIMSMNSSIIIAIIVAFILLGISGPSLIITLSMLYVLYGIAGMITKGFPITTLPRWFNKVGSGYIAGVIPIPAFVLVIVFIIISIVLHYTSFGREVFAVGSNEEAARLCGINVMKVKITVMVLVQILAVLSGILLSAQVMSGSHTFGKGYELNVIAAVIFGGTSFSGGKGTAWGTFIGLIFLGVITNAMVLLNISEYTQWLVRGLLIVIAVIINSLTSNSSSK